MSVADSSYKFCEGGNYADLEDACRLSPVVAETAILAIVADTMGGGNMPKTLASYIIRRWVEAGHDKTADPIALLRQMAEMVAKQHSFDAKVYPPGKVVFVVNTAFVLDGSKGRIARPVECEGKARSDSLFVVLDECRFLSRIIAVKKINLLDQPLHIATVASQSSFFCSTEVPLRGAAT